MHIEHNQQLEVHNLISFRKVVTPHELNELGERMLAYAQSQGAQKVGGGISATYAMYGNKFDVAMYVPINKEIPSSEEFEYKKKLLLVNCIKMTYKGHPQGLEAALVKMNEYTATQGLTPVSVCFIVTANEAAKSKEFNKVEVDVYIPISEDINEKQQ